MWLFAAAAEDLRLGFHLAGRDSVDDLHVAKLLAVLVHGVAGDEEAKDLFFILQARVLVPLGYAGQRIFVVACSGMEVGVEDAEEAVLAGGFVALRFLCALHGLVECGGELGAAAKGVHGSGFDERFEDALVEQAKVNLFAELVEAGEALLPCCLQCGARGDDRFDGVMADVLDCRETEANGLSCAVMMGVKLASETCTFGGTTGMFISRHSEMYLTTFSGFEVSLVRSAAMNSTG